MFISRAAILQRGQSSLVSAQQQDRAGKGQFVPGRVFVWQALSAHTEGLLTGLGSLQNPPCAHYWNINPAGGHSDAAMKEETEDFQIPHQVQTLLYPYGAGSSWEEQLEFKFSQAGERCGARAWFRFFTLGRLWKGESHSLAFSLGEEQGERGVVWAKGL